MENDAMPLAPAEVEGGTDMLEEYVTITRAELEALRAGAVNTSEARPATQQDPGRESRRSVEPSEETVRRAVSGEELDARKFEAIATRDFESREQRLAELERTCKDAVRDRELATTLAGRRLVSGAASQLIKLWRDEFDAYEDGAGYKVAAKDGRGVGQVVGEWLASAEYSHFCLPTSRGGTGARDANRPAGTTTPAPTPRNLGEAIVMKWRDDSATKPNNMVRPIGLRRHQ